jgi:RNA polymerase sigma-70 factor (ECF subfamily)
VVAAQPTPAYFAALYARSGGEKFGLSYQDFAALLREVSDRYLPEASSAEIQELHNSLHVEELVLARACARGCEPAWDCFLSRYRQKLYEVAAAIARDETVGRELADSLYADLFTSKLASYTGRGSLEGWLRTVLAQEYINRYRSQRRLAPLDESQSGQSAAEDPPDPRLEQAVDEALAELAADERLLLASWYLDGRTLAEIARMLGVHESTISRRMEKITTSLRKRILRGLRRRGMDARAAEDALKSDVRDISLDIQGRLTQETSGATFYRRSH